MTDTENKIKTPEDQIENDVYYNYLIEKLEDNGINPTDVSYFISPYFVNAITGISDDGRLIYDYDLMISSAMEEQNWTEEEAIDWIEVNTIPTIPYIKDKAPIIQYSFF